MRRESWMKIWNISAAKQKKGVVAKYLLFFHKTYFFDRKLI